MQKQVDSLKIDYKNAADKCEFLYEIKQNLKITLQSELKKRMLLERQLEMSDIQALSSKHENTWQHLKLQKSENKSLQKSNKSFSVALKSDTIKKKDEEIKKMSDKMKNLLEFKVTKDNEAREIKKKEKKLVRKRKKEDESNDANV